MEQLPKHIGIIMDGNGRWAQERGLKRSQGHIAGADNLKKLLRHIRKKTFPTSVFMLFLLKILKEARKKLVA